MSIYNKQRLTLLWHFSCWFQTDPMHICSLFISNFEQIFSCCEIAAISSLWRIWSSHFSIALPLAWLKYWDWQEWQSKHLHREHSYLHVKGIIFFWRKHLIYQILLKRRFTWSICYLRLKGNLELCAYRKITSNTSILQTQRYTLDFFRLDELVLVYKSRKTQEFKNSVRMFGFLFCFQNSLKINPNTKCIWIPLFQYSQKINPNTLCIWNGHTQFKKSCSTYCKIFRESMNNLWIVGVTGSFFEKFVFYPFISLKSIWVQTGSRPLFNASNKYLKPTNNFFWSCKGMTQM